MDEITFANTLISIVALFLAIFSLYLQYKVRGPLIELLNAKDVQRHVPRYHKELPQDIQERFPHIEDTMPGYALVKLIFGNSGDRVGIANIQSVVAKIVQSGETGIIKVSCDKYTLVPAYAIVEKEILLRNIQTDVETPIELEIELTIEYGGYNPESTEYKHQGTMQKRILVILVRGDEAGPWLISGSNPFYTVG